VDANGSYGRATPCAATGTLTLVTHTCWASPPRTVWPQPRRVPSQASPWPPRLRIAAPPRWVSLALTTAVADAGAATNAVTMPRPWVVGGLLGRAVTAAAHYLTPPRSSLSHGYDTTAS
jgi:hypothetical protein